MSANAFIVDADKWKKAELAFREGSPFRKALAAATIKAMSRVLLREAVSDLQATHKFKRRRNRHSKLMREYNKELKEKGVQIRLDVYVGDEKRALRTLRFDKSTYEKAVWKPQYILNWLDEGTKDRHTKSRKIGLRVKRARRMRSVARSGKGRFTGRVSPERFMHSIYSRAQVGMEEAGQNEAKRIIMSMLP
jgi:hypothetical protein